MRNRPRLLDGIPEPWAVEWGEDRHGLFMSFAVDECVQKLRYIPPGRFLMGSPESEVGRFDDEGPQHEVQLTQGYWLADTPCTQALWQAVMGQNPSQFMGPKRPVENVSWDDCQEFLLRLNERAPGLRVRLPSEAEWEYACRAGSSGSTKEGELDGMHTATIIDLYSYLEFGTESEGRTHPVSSNAASLWGLYDMLDNVWEWCEDEHGTNAAPTDSTVRTVRIVRGGTSVGRSGAGRRMLRSAELSDRRYDRLGLRVARGQVKS